MRMRRAYMYARRVVEGEGSLPSAWEWLLGLALCFQIKIVLIWKHGVINAGKPQTARM